MHKISTSLRLLLLAATTSCALTSCFGDKKCDPKPKDPTICFPAPKTGAN